ncbi:hypothetical protein [Azorhizobium doebereinerae]|uniref:hypothetical protein n=1 Tax=Azorhizobium doebereinerae TaxID=281091 RepID=UPI0003F8B169|nr:hypothetical protein [Azorhizobium doebereinerae]
MLGYGSRSSTTDISRQIDALKTDLAKLGEALADAAAENSRAPRREAARYADRALHLVEDGAQALAAGGLSLARDGSRSAARKMGRTVDRAEHLVSANPGTAVLAAVAVGLTVGAVLYAIAAGERAGRR